MSAPSDVDPMTKTVRTGQVISLAMISGLMTFLVVVLVARSRPINAPMPGGAESHMLTYIAVASVVLLIPGMLLLPAQAVSAARRQIAVVKLKSPTEQFEAFLPLFLTWLIIGSALLEGAGFLCLITYMIEGSPVALFLAMLLIVGLLMRFPTRNGVERWVEEQMQRLDEAK